VDVRVTVRLSGPIFGGRAPGLVRDFLADATRDIAEQGEIDVRTHLARVLKHPTGYYQSNIRHDRVGADMVVHDHGVVYGPWLEGTGSRNQTTRFKGYATFRRTTQQLQGKADTIAARALARLIERLHG
jgi:hypothetical protein